MRGWAQVPAQEREREPHWLPDPRLPAQMLLRPSRCLRQPVRCSRNCLLLPVRTPMDHLRQAAVVVHLLQEQVPVRGLDWLPLLWRGARECCSRNRHLRNQEWPMILKT